MNDKDLIKKLERRIHNQRVRLRWWETLFHDHVNARWRGIYLTQRSENRKRSLLWKKRHKPEDF